MPFFRSFVVAMRVLAPSLSGDEGPSPERGTAAESSRVGRPGGTVTRWALGPGHSSYSSALALAGDGSGCSPAGAADGPRPPGPVAQGNPDFTANVMAPLKVTDWADFEHDLAAVAAYGVDAVSVDVWWGDVEKARRQPVRLELLRPRLRRRSPTPASTSRRSCPSTSAAATSATTTPACCRRGCGRSTPAGRVDGDPPRASTGCSTAASRATTPPRPCRAGPTGWWRTSTATSPGRSPATSRRASVATSSRSTCRWARPASCATRRTTATTRARGYPTRGAPAVLLAARGPGPAGRGRSTATARCGASTGPGAPHFRSVQPDPAAGRRGRVLRDRRLPQTRATARDFVDWYNGSLVAHGKRMLTTVIDALGQHFRRADVGYKVPGIHWQMGDGSPYPRATEVTTGLIQTSVDESAWRTGHGYARIVELGSRPIHGRHVVMHFTALEMGDNNPGEPDAATRPAALLAGQDAGRLDRRLRLPGRHRPQGRERAQRWRAVRLRLGPDQRRLRRPGATSASRCCGWATSPRAPAPPATRSSSRSTADPSPPSGTSYDCLTDSNHAFWLRIRPEVGTPVPAVTRTWSGVARPG